MGGRLENFRPYHCLVRDDLQRGLRMRTAVCIRVAVSRRIQAEKFGILVDEFPRQQLPHGVQFIFHCQTKLSAARQKFFPCIAEHEITQDIKAPCRVQSNRRQAGLVRTIRPIRKREVEWIQYDAPRAFRWSMGSNCGHGHGGGDSLEKLTAIHGFSFD